MQTLCQTQAHRGQISTAVPAKKGHQSHVKMEGFIGILPLGGLSLKGQIPCFSHALYKTLLCESSVSQTFL